MPEVIETIVYTFEELQPKAREAARDWYRADAPHDGWWQWVYEDFQMICECLGIILKTRPTNSGKAQASSPCIWFSGFWNQGDGACFEGTWRYRSASSLAIRAHAPNDMQLHEIADMLQAIQQRNFYQLVADITQQGRYCHAFCMYIAVERDAPNGQEPTGDAEDVVTQTMRDLARWLYARLETEYDHLTSAPEIDEAIIANEYRFTATGERFG